ncbi:MAG TPA: hypothetical protein VM848_18045 [Acidimicrobiia bacterium]|nr:hypothetical protein [Acidimicrobiia bacterium]
MTVRSLDEWEDADGAFERGVKFGPRVELIHRDQAVNAELESRQLDWLDARLKEYRDLLEHLRDH